MTSKELIQELEKIPCMVSKSHKRRLVNFSTKTKSFTLDCPACEKLGFTNIIKGNWKTKDKKKEV